MLSTLLHDLDLGIQVQKSPVTACGTYYRSLFPRIVCVTHYHQRQLSATNNTFMF